VENFSNYFVDELLVYFVKPPIIGIVLYHLHFCQQVPNVAATWPARMDVSEARTLILDTADVPPRFEPKLSQPIKKSLIFLKANTKTLILAKSASIYHGIPW